MPISKKSEIKFHDQNHKQYTLEGHKSNVNQYYGKSIQGYLSSTRTRPSPSQNFSIKFRLTVHIRARFPNTYIGIENSMHASWMPPIAINVFLEPLDSSQCGKKSEKTKPWSTSGLCVSAGNGKREIHEGNGKRGTHSCRS